MRNHVRFFASTAIALFATSLLPAQAVAPTSSTAEKSSSPDDAIVMSPFTIKTEKDTGYIAADTLNAGRLSTQLLMTPGSIDVFTRDLINDLGVFNIDEASAWLTNSRPLELGATEGNSMNPGSLAQQDSGTNVSLRGLPGSTNPSTRNYFTSASTPKEYNVERVESSRGPNAILYGEGGPGGSVNYNTKRAQSRNFGALRLRFDDLSTKAVSLDVNRKLTDQLDMRYNLGLMDKRYYLDRARFKEIGNALNVVYRPFERTSITVDFDLTRNTRPGLIMTYGEQYAKWDGQTVTGKPTFTAAQLTAKGLNVPSAGKRLVWTDGIGLQDYAGYTRTIGYGLPQPTESGFGDTLFPSNAANTPGVSRIAPLPTTFNANPDDIDVTDKARDLQVSFDHTFRNKLSLQVAGQTSNFSTKGGSYTFTTFYIDQLTQLPDGRPNPNLGKPYANAYAGRTIDFKRDSKSVRLVAAYPLQHWGGTTNLSAFLTHQQKSDTTIYTDLHVKEPAGSTVSITDASSLIWVNRYFDNLSDSLPDFRTTLNAVDVPVLDSRNKQKIQAYQVALSGNYFHDTLSVVAGFRRDRSELDSLTGVVASRNTQTGAFTAYTPDSRTGYNNTKVLGFVYFPIKLLGVYANHGEGFTIQTNSNLRMDGSFGKTNIVPANEKSIGLRFNLGGTSQVKVIGSVGYYHAEQEGVIQTVGVAAVNQLWRDLGIFEGKDYSANYIDTFSADPFTTAATNSISSTRSIEAKGWEASLTANVGNSFRLTVNGALPQTKQSDTAPEYVAYVNQNKATWQSFVSKPGIPNAQANATNLAQIQGFIDGFADGRTQNLTYKYRYNLFGVYTVRGTPLKGLRLGGGVQFYGKSLIGNPANQPFNYIYAKTYHLVSGQIGYPFKIGNYRVDAQLNVDNLLDYDDTIFSGLFAHVLNGVTYQIPYGRKNVWPRSYRLTLTVPF